MRCSIVYCFCIVSASLNYYTGSSFEFIRDYGQRYHLFDQFFNFSTEYVSYIDSTLKISPEYRVYSSIGESFKLRSLDDYYKGETSVGSGRFVNYISYGGWGSSSIPSNLLEFNNRFRFGGQPHDRFTDIFFKGDPWEQLKTGVENATIRFAGYEVDISEEIVPNIYCNFSYPISRMEPFRVKHFSDDNVIGPSNKLAREKHYW